MKVIVLDQPGGIENLLIKELPVPEIKDNEVLIEVKAISINPVDVKTRMGKGVYGRIKEEKPLVLGWDVSGIVRQCSTGSVFQPGDEVFGMVNFPGHGKAYAEFVVAPESHLAHKPENISHEEAAAATLAALTAWQAMVHHAKIKKGDRVLIHAAAGGVGHFAVQLAKYLGASVIGTSSQKNQSFVKALGADQHIDYQKSPFENEVSDLDFVLDTIGGEYIDRSLKIIKKGGTIISIPSGLNEAVSQKAKEKDINGYFILVQSAGEDMKQVASLLEKGILKAHVSEIFPFEKMGDAHLQLESGRTVGKVIVKV